MMRYGFINQTPKYLQSQCSYRNEGNDNVKLLLSHIRKMQNTFEVEILEINKITPLIKVKIGGKGLDVNVRKVWVL